MTFLIGLFVAMVLFGIVFPVGKIYWALLAVEAIWAVFDLVHTPRGDR